MAKDMKISVFGLGKLGCTMLACFAEKGWEVIGMDVNEEFVTKINTGMSPVYEPGVAELIKKNISRISATLDPKKAVENSDISFVVVPTPSNEFGAFSTKMVEAVAAEIGSVLRAKEKYHVVVITSTVLPGDMQNIVTLLEKTSGKKIIKDFGVCYNPDFIALGTVVKNFLNPDMVLIGESDPMAGDHLHSIHKELVENDPRIHRMNFYNAELAKISLNSYCTLKITFANIIAEICEKMPGGDSDLVTNAIGDDLRIGRKYLKGGLSYGGPCFPRDNRAFAVSAKRFGVTKILAENTDEINNYQRNQRLPNLLLAKLKEKKQNKISVLGITYKSDTTLVEESASLCIIKALLENGISVNVYDPAGIEAAKQELTGFQNVSFSNSPIECIRGSSVCFIGTPWNEIKELRGEDFVNQMLNPTIIDGWHLFDFTDTKGIDYIVLGKN